MITSTTIRLSIIIWQPRNSFSTILPSDAFALVNVDDKNGRVMLQNCKAKHYTFSIRSVADYRCRIIEQGFEGMAVKIQGDEVWTRFIGEFNASNLLAVFAASELLGASTKGGTYNSQRSASGCRKT